MMVHVKLNSFLLLSYGKRLVTHEEPPCGSGCDEPELEIEPTQLPNLGSDPASWRRRQECLPDHVRGGYESGKVEGQAAEGRRFLQGRVWEVGRKKTSTSRPRHGRCHASGGCQRRVDQECLIFHRRKWICEIL